MQNFTLDLTALKAVSLAMSNEVTRFYLCGVHVFYRDGQIIYEASNGHILLRVRRSTTNEDAVNDDLDVIIPDWFVNLVLKNMKHFDVNKKDPICNCTVDGVRKEVTFETPNITLSTLSLSAKYPETDRFIPTTDKEVFSTRTNPDLLSTLFESIEIFTGFKGVDQVKLFQENEGEAYRATCLSPDWTGCIMPLSL
jgi:DNA polymerase III sliding clamp (beta) subunit (PCNA family)